MYKHFLVRDKKDNRLTVILQDKIDNFCIFCCDESCSPEWIETEFEIIKEINLEDLNN